MHNHKLTRLRHFLFILFSLFGLSLLTACNSVDNEKVDHKKLTQHVTQGQAYLKQYQLQAAFKEANIAIKIAPTELEAYLILVKVHAQLGQLKEGIAKLEKFTGEKDSDYYFALLDSYQKYQKLPSANKILLEQSALLSQSPLKLQLAQAKQWIAENQISKAQQSLMQLKENEDYKTESKIALAHTYILEEKLDDALSILQEITQDSINNYEALLLQGKIYLSQQQYSQSERSLTLALNALPNADVFTSKKIDVLENLILLLNEQGRNQEAMIYAQLLSSELPLRDVAQQRYSEASEAFNKGELEKAKEILEALLKSVPKHEQAITLLGVIYYQQGDISNANKYLAKVVDPDRSSSTLNNMYALTELKSKRTSEIMQYLEKIPEEQFSSDTWALYITAAITEKQFSKAKSALDIALSLNNSEPRFILLQNIYFNSLAKPQHQQALDALKEALKQSPTHSQLQVAYIKQLLKGSDNAGANNYVDQLQTNYPDDIATQLIVANYHAYRKNYSQARSQLAHILQLENNNLTARYLLNNFDLREEKWEKTLVNYKEIIQIDPLQLKAYVGLANSLQQLQKDPMDSEKFLPENYHRGLLALTLSDRALQSSELALATTLSLQAKEHLEGSFQGHLDKLNLNISIRKIQSLLAQKQSPQARKLIVEELTKEDNNIYLLKLLADIEIENKQYNEAQKIINKIAQLFPNIPLANSLQADFYLAQGKNKQAIEFYELVLQSQPNHLISLNNIAWLYFQEGDDRALQYAQEAYKMAPKNASILDTYGWILANNNQYEKGKKLLQTALSFAPDNQEIQDHLQQIEHL